LHELGLAKIELEEIGKRTESRLYSKVWPMLSIFDSNKQKTPLEISVVFDRWGAVL
jgi:hypothetical protein